VDTVWERRVRLEERDETAGDEYEEEEEEEEETEAEAEAEEKEDDEKEEEVEDATSAIFDGPPLLAAEVLAHVWQALVLVREEHAADTPRAFEDGVRASPEQAVASRGGGEHGDPSGADTGGFRCLLVDRAVAGLEAM